MKKYWVNYEWHTVARQEKKPIPFEVNRYDHGESEWVEVDENTYIECLNSFGGKQETLVNSNRPLKEKEESKKMKQYEVIIDLIGEEDNFHLPRLEEKIEGQKPYGFKDNIFWMETVGGAEIFVPLGAIKTISVIPMD